MSALIVPQNFSSSSFPIPIGIFGRLVDDIFSALDANDMERAQSLSDSYRYLRARQALICSFSEARLRRIEALNAQTAARLDVMEAALVGEVAR